MVSFNKKFSLLFNVWIEKTFTVRFVPFLGVAFIHESFKISMQNDEFHYSIGVPVIRLMCR